METVWIQVFILTLTQCIAPAGKMVCQEEQVRYQFLQEDDCQHALKQMVNVASAADNVIVNESRSACSVAAVESSAFSSIEEANAKLGNNSGYETVARENQQADFTQSAHQERLKDLKDCDAVSGVAPCKIGEIIIEAAAEATPTEIWRQQK